MRTTVSIDDVLLERAKQQAARTGTTLGAVVDEALREHLTPRRRVAAVDLPVFTGGDGLRAGIDPTSNRDLYDALDESEGIAP